jgi:hypothetical protein
MMANHSNKKAGKTSRDLSEILNRVDQLPVLDNRSPDEIVGYDEHGVPSSAMPPTPAVPAQRAPDSVQDPDMEDWRKAFGDNIPAAVKEFLQYRHREWELEMEDDLKARQEAKAGRTQKS